MLETYDVFISYRREGGADKARLFQHALTERGLRVFIDVDELGSGYFDERLLRIIENARNFLLILSPGSLSRCRNPDDWLRREIEHAMKTGRNIVPIFDRGFVFPDAEELPESIRSLPRHNCIFYDHFLFREMTDKLMKIYLKKAEDEIFRVGFQNNIWEICPCCGSRIRLA